jgi:hypothetical protein
VLYQLEGRDKMTNDRTSGPVEIVLFLLALGMCFTVLCYVVLPAVAAVARVDDLPMTDHALEIRPSGIGATTISAYIAIGLCKPRSFVCADETIKVVCEFPGGDGTQWFTLLVISTRGLPLEKIISGEIGPRIVTGIPARTQSYIDNTLRNNNCKPVDLPWMGAQ